MYLLNTSEDSQICLSIIKVINLSRMKGKLGKCLAQLDEKAFRSNLFFFIQHHVYLNVCVFVCTDRYTSISHYLPIGTGLSVVAFIFGTVKLLSETFLIGE